jgi:hypothetical protein
MSKTYEELKAELLDLRAQGKIGRTLTPEQRADWAYGNTAVENTSATREMADKAVEQKAAQQK